jgi:hypothetical protein
MRYWGYLALKLSAVAAFLRAGWWALNAWWPAPEPFLTQIQTQRFARDLGFTTAVMILWLIAVGLVYLAVVDQRLRCRTCLRPLRMPVSRGSWNQVLLGPPRTEYICPYGHGTLRVPELHLPGASYPAWEPIDDMWKELEELGTGRK